ncbi:MAG: DUF2934 domain-containing protein [Nitrospira sp.]|nr:DUF2934 domain-containing protein [Nitrospira sp.]
MGAMVKPAKRAKPEPRRSAPRPQKAITLPGDLWERISNKAYELWEQRGRLEDHALRDWLDAEAIVMEEVHEARE